MKDQYQEQNRKQKQLNEGPGGGILQLPFWNDFSWSQPEYYETIQAGLRRQPKTGRSTRPPIRPNADVNNDQQDELFARGPRGILVNVFDPAMGQWLPMIVPQFDGKPIFSDAEGWNQPQYYQTIQTADIDGDGQAELLARDASGIEVWKFVPGQNYPPDGTWIQISRGPVWSDQPINGVGGGWNQPQYYTTIQTADIDGDGQAELLARDASGIEVWKFVPAQNYPPDGTWTQMSRGPDWSDTVGWNLPQYYQTIQCADIDGNGQGTLCELLGQGPDGMEMWAFDWRPDSPTHNTWIKGANVWSAEGNFTQPQYYRTIQLADIDGDGGQELIVRSPSGILAWKWWGNLPADPTRPQQWVPLPPGPVWSDQPINGVGGGWDQPQYYETIQCADIDGDGQAELLARDASGIEVWKFVPGQNYPPDGTWIQMPRGPAWSDAAGWDQVERYSTIQTAMVNLPNRHTAPPPPYALLGRGPLGMQTWYYSPSTKTWQQTSTGYPAFTPSQHAAYLQLDISLRGSAANRKNGIRSAYNDTTAPFALTWIPAMYSAQLEYNTPPDKRPHTKLPLPTTNPPTQADWDAVTWQIYWEMVYVVSVNDWYGNKTNGLINQTFMGKDFDLQTVGGFMQYSSEDDTQVALSILALLFGIVAGVTGFPELEAGELAAVATMLGTAFSGAASLLPNGGNVQTAYNQLQAQLTNAFSEAVTVNGNNQFLITGGTNEGGSYVPADWGLLYGVGQLIFSTIWTWPSDTKRLKTAMQQSYCVTVAQALLAASPPVTHQAQGPWIVYYNSSAPGLLPSGFPPQYSYGIFPGYGQNVYAGWLGTSRYFDDEYPPLSQLSALFDPKTYGAVTPLGVPLSDVYLGNNGWPQLRIINTNA